MGNKFVQVLKINAKAFCMWFHKYPFMFLSSTISIIYNALIPYLYIYLSAQLINELTGERNIDRLKTIVIVIVFSSLILGIVGEVMKRWSNCTSACLEYKKEKFFIDKLLSMDYENLDSSYVHDRLSQIRQNESFAGYGLNKVVDIYKNLILSLTKIIGALVLCKSLFTSNVLSLHSNLTFLNRPILGAGLFFMMVFVTFLSPYLSNKAKAYWASVASKARITNRMYRFYGFLAYDSARALDIRIHRQDLMCKNGYHMFNAFSSEGEIAKCARGYMGILLSCSVAISYLFTICVYLYVCIKAWGGAFGIGSVTQYIAAITALSAAFSSLIAVYGDMSSNEKFLHTVFELLEVKHRLQDGNRGIDKQSVNEYCIEFKDVYFRYENMDKDTLKNINVKIEPKCKLEIVGENGSGKTTFLKLLCRLYEPTSGKITLNGINIKEFKYEEYIRLLSVVFQDCCLLALPVSNNISSSYVIKDRSRINQCLKQTGMLERVNAMPTGMDTYLYKEFDNDGINISGGEAQKLVFSRALFKKFEFLILDEPTAALDPIAESKVYKDMELLSKNKSTLFISHRLSASMFCDKILVFENGKIIQTGSHSELMKDKDGKYYSLWNAQAQYYVE